MSASLMNAFLFKTKSKIYKHFNIFLDDLDMIDQHMKFGTVAGKAS
jgi:hypothetical protein